MQIANVIVNLNHNTSWVPDVDQDRASLWKCRRGWRKLCVVRDFRCHLMAAGADDGDVRDFCVLVSNTNAPAAATAPQLATKLRRTLLTMTLLGLILARQATGSYHHANGPGSSSAHDFQSCWRHAELAGPGADPWPQFVRSTDGRRVDDSPGYLEKSIRGGALGELGSVPYQSESLNLGDPLSPSVALRPAPKGKPALKRVVPLPAGKLWRIPQTPFAMSQARCGGERHRMRKSHDPADAGRSITGSRQSATGLP